MKKIISLLLAITVAFSLVATASATQETISDERISIENESNRQYNAMLNTFRNDEGILVYPDYYGGAFLNSAGLLVVSVTQKTPAIEEALKKQQATMLSF